MPLDQPRIPSAYLKAKRRVAEEAMIICTYRQGHGAAAHALGVTADVRKNFAAALEYYQAGTKFGNKHSAAAMMFFFDTKNWGSLYKQDQNALTQLGILPDPERKSRYNQIFDTLDINPDLRLTRLDQVVPLPPAELPPWQGIEDAIEPEPDRPPTY